MTGSRVGRIGLMVVAAAAATARGNTSISYSLINPGSSVVTAGMPFTLEIWATFDAPLVAAQYTLRASGAATATMTARSQNPVGPVGLTYLSQTSQDPFASGLPHDLSAAPLTEVAYDADFGGVPGGPIDGVPPNPSGERLDTITIVAGGTGSLTIAMSDADAATTQGAPDGVVFDNVSVTSGSVVLTVETNPGDWDGDGDVDLDDFVPFAECLSGPAEGDGFAAPSQQCLTVFDTDPSGAPDGDVDLADFAVFQGVFSG